MRSKIYARRSDIISPIGGASRYQRQLYPKNLPNTLGGIYVSVRGKSTQHIQYLA
jgi:hypothetical protein